MQDATLDLQTAALTPRILGKVRKPAGNPYLRRVLCRTTKGGTENARLLLDVGAEHGGFHEYVRFLGADEDPEGAADELSGRFHHLGRTSSLFFLFSAGWRDLSNDAEEVEVDQAS